MGTFVPQSDGDHNVVSPSLARLGEEIKGGGIDGILHGVCMNPSYLYTLYFSPFIHHRYHMYTPVNTRYTRCTYCIYTIYRILYPILP